MESRFVAGPFACCNLRQLTLLYGESIHIKLRLRAPPNILRCNSKHCRLVHLAVLHRIILSDFNLFWTEAFLLFLLPVLLQVRRLIQCDQAVGRVGHWLADVVELAVEGFDGFCIA